MGLAQKIIGFITGNGAEVDAGNNLRVTTPQVSQRLGGETPVPERVGAVRLFVEHDAGAATGTPVLRSPAVTENGRLSMAQDTLLWHAMFPGAAQHTGMWKHVFSTMTVTQVGDGFITLNSNLSGLSGAACAMQSWKHFALYDITTWGPVFQVSIGNGNPVANQVLEWGAFVPALVPVAPTDGVWLRYSTAGLYGYIKFGAGAEIASAQLLPANGLTVGVTDDYLFAIDERGVSFTRGDDILGSIEIPPGAANLYQTLSLPIAFQQRNLGTVTGTQAQLKASCTSVYQHDLIANKPWSHLMAGIGQSNQGLDGGTMGQLALWGNSAAPTAAALANATAAFTGLGGIVAVLPTLAVNTDGILINYTNPLGSTTQPPKSLVVLGLTLHGAVSVALTGGPVVYAVAVAYGHNAVSLATAESASFANNTTKAPRRVPIGFLSFAATAVVGTMSPVEPIQIRFDAPLVLNPGENVAVILRNVGVVTTLGAITLTPSFDHHFE